MEIIRQSSDPSQSVSQSISAVTFLYMYSTTGTGQYTTQQSSGRLAASPHLTSFYSGGRGPENLSENWTIPLLKTEMGKRESISSPL